MRKLSIKGWSLLGSVLMAASAVTAAVLPGGSDKKVVKNGTLRNLSGDDGAVDIWTCTADIDTVNSCTATDDTNSSEIASDSIVGRFQTLNNTTRLLTAP